MSKRFTDTDKWKKQFIRSLTANYKLLWLYVVDDCDHAGIWHLDFEIASIYLGVEVNEIEAKKQFSEKIEVINGGKQWFIKSFIDFQYGELKETNRAHNSVLKILKNKGLTRGLHALKDKDKDKDKDKQFAIKIFAQLGMTYIEGNPSTGRTEIEIFKWLKTQDVEYQIKNLESYLKATDKKFIAQSASTIMAKLEERKWEAKKQFKQEIK